MESENLETGNIHYEVRAWSEPDGWVPSLGSYFLPQGRSAMSKGIWILTLRCALGGPQRGVRTGMASSMGIPSQNR